MTTDKQCCYCLVASIMSDSVQAYGLQPTRLLCPWILQARILEWVAISFSRGSSQSRDQTWVSCIAGRFFTTELPEKPQTHNRDGINKR